MSEPIQVTATGYDGRPVVLHPSHDFGNLFCRACGAFGFDDPRLRRRCKPVETTATLDAARSEPVPGLRDLLRRLDGWRDDDARYESADEMVDVARRDIRAALRHEPVSEEAGRAALDALGPLPWQTWNRIEQPDGMAILDPDGFRHGKPEVVTYAAFLARRMECTMADRRDLAGWGAALRADSPETER